jgi:hypothetical protein
LFFKHSLTLTLLFVISIVANARKANVVTVSGKLGYISEEKRMLSVTYRKIGGGFAFDSVIVYKGNFKIEKQLTEPIVAILTLKPQGSITGRQEAFDYVSIFLLPGDVKIEAPKNLKDCIVTGKGASANDLYQVYLRNLNLYVDTLNKAVQSIRNLKGVEREKRITQIADSINEIRDEQVYLKFFTTKTQSPVAAYALLQYSAEPVWTPRRKMVPGEIEKLIRRLPQNLQSYPSIQNLKEEIKVAKSTGYGKPIIDFTLEDTDGKLVKLSDFKGRYVFLDFWASWCVPCRKENPNVNSSCNIKTGGLRLLVYLLINPMQDKHG